MAKVIAWENGAKVIREMTAQEAAGIAAAADAAKVSAKAAMVVSRLQARAALMQAGLLESIDAAINDGEGISPIVKLAWQEAQDFKRTSPTMVAVAAMLGLTDAQIDDLFEAAAAIDL